MDSNKSREDDSYFLLQSSYVASDMDAAGYYPQFPSSETVIVYCALCRTFVVINEKMLELHKPQFHAQ